MSLSDRELEYYVVACGNTSMNAVILQHWNMFMGSKKYVYNYVYCSYIENDVALFIFKNDAGYYVVKSSENQKEEIEDEFERIQKELNGIEEQEEDHVIVDRYGSLKQCIDDGLTKRERECLGLTKTGKIKLSAELKKDLQGIVCVDFITVKDSDYEDMLQDYIYLCDDKLRLSMIPYLTCNELQHMTFKDSINTVILSNNELLDSLVWLSNVPKLKTLYISSCASIHDKSVKELVSVCSGLEEISFYNCQNITLESMTYLLSITIKSISFMNIKMKCIHEPLKSLISKEQWISLVDAPGSKSLEYLDINAITLTKDLLHDLLYCCTSIERISIHHELFNKFLKDIHGSKYGSGDSLTICATYDQSMSCDFTKPVSIGNLLRDQFENPFSSSMLSVIKKIKNDCSL
ncbi:hypothetical protein N9064_00395 [bacterium]|nr:hypothetical protein [bacterium]